jgi:NADPH2:quinone reductase
MRAAALDRFGGPEVLTLHTLPVPAIEPNEVLIRVHTAGVGSWDADMRGGWWPFGKPRFPIVPGSDGSGIIAAAGSRVRRFETGERVYSYSFANAKGGFYAEYVAVAAENAAPIPPVLNMVRAGAVPTTGLTALQGIDDALKVKRGETVIVHGASGGVGTLAVQFAKLRGARVLATASGRDGVALARRLGADMAVDGKTADIAEAVREFAPDGVDAVLALVDGPALTQCRDALTRGGRLAYPTGVEPAPRKKPGITVIPYDGSAGVREFQRFNRAVEAARLKVPIAATFALADAAEAHRRIAQGHVLGKIVLRIR